MNNSQTLSRADIPLKIAIAKHLPAIETPKEFLGVYSRAQELYLKLPRMLKEERATKAVEYAYKLVKHGDGYFNHEGHNPFTD